MTDKDIIIAQRKHYAECMTKAVSLCLTAQRPDLARAIDGLSKVYGIESVLILPKEDNRVKCLPGHSRHNFLRGTADACVRCGRPYLDEVLSRSK